MPYLLWKHNCTVKLKSVLLYLKKKRLGYDTVTLTHSITLEINMIKIYLLQIQQECIKNFKITPTLRKMQYNLFFIFLVYYLTFYMNDEIIQNR